MLNDFDMVTHKFSDEINIIPISDVHLGAIEHNKSAWDSFVRSIPDNTYLILGGDLISNGVRNSVGNPFDEIYRPSEQKKIMVEHLKPIKDKILCAVSGNHEARSRKESDVDITYDIMSKLDIEDVYRENAVFMKISLGERADDKSPKVSYTFCVVHGTGGGVYTSGTVLRNERFGNVIENLDCLVVGHTHKGTITRPSKIVIDRKNSTVTMQSYLVLSMESWQSFGGYAMRKMLLPAETSVPQKLRLVNSKDGKRIETTW